MKTIKFCTEEESRFLRLPEPAESRKSNSTKNGTQHSLRPNKAEETVDDSLNPLQTSRTVAGQIHSNPKSHKSCVQKYELLVEQVNDDYTNAPLKAYLKDGTGGI